MIRHGYIIEKIVDRENLSNAFDLVMSDKRRNASVQKFISKKELILDRMADEIECNLYAPHSYKEFSIFERRKNRVIQSLPFYDRIALNAIMSVCDTIFRKTYIRDTYSSIKGRGVHDGLKRLRKGLLDRESTVYCLKTDVRKFYPSVDQDVLIAMLDGLFKDSRLIDTLTRIIRSYPKGLSIGYRSSQEFGNYYLSPFDHYMKEVQGAKYYYRYCDDIVILSSSKEELHRLLEVMRSYLSEKLHITIKDNYQIFPVESRGIDFLGYVSRHDYSVVRKDIKQQSARRLNSIKSRKRRVQILGSAWGWMKHADCANLWYKLTDMKNFSELGVRYTPADGKKRFEGNITPLGNLQNCEITVLDFEMNIKTKEGEGRFVVQFEMNGSKGKFITNSEEMKSILMQIKEANEFPFKSIIRREIFGQNKAKYNFS